MFTLKENDNKAFVTEAYRMVGSSYYQYMDEASMSLGEPTELTGDADYNTSIRVILDPVRTLCIFDEVVKYNRALASWFNEGGKKALGTVVVESNTTFLDVMEDKLKLDKKYIVVTDKVVKDANNKLYTVTIKLDLSKGVNGGTKFGGPNDNLTHIADADIVVTIKTEEAIYNAIKVKPTTPPVDIASFLPLEDLGFTPGRPINTIFSFVRSNNPLQPIYYYAVSKETNKPVIYPILLNSGYYKADKSAANVLDLRKMMGRWIDGDDSYANEFGHMKNMLDNTELKIRASEGNVYYVSPLLNRADITGYIFNFKVKPIIVTKYNADYKDSITGNGRAIDGMKDIYHV